MTRVANLQRVNETDDQEQEECIIGFLILQWQKSRRTDGFLSGTLRYNCRWDPHVSQGRFESIVDSWTCTSSRYCWTRLLHTVEVDRPLIRPNELHGVLLLVAILWGGSRRGARLEATNSGVRLCRLGLRTEEGVASERRRPFQGASTANIGLSAVS